MDIKSFFNIILLGLSLTTIFITLVSYIIFKLRQASSAGSVDQFHKIEGVYFRRHAPKLEEENRLKKIELEKDSRNPRKFYLKIVSIFMFLFLIIVTVFLIEDYYTRRNHKLNSVPPETIYD